MIVSSANPKVKDMRAARRCKDERALLEGPHLVAAALAAGLELDIVVATERFLDSADARRLLAALPRAPLAIAPSVLGELCDSDSPRGIAAVVTIPERGMDRIPVRSEGTYVYADGLQDPGNLGALARCVEGAEAHALLLGPACAHPNHPRALRASAGSLLRLPTAPIEAPTRLDDHLGATARWIGLDGAAPQSLYRVELPDLVVLAVGSEAHGLSAPVRARLDTTLSIPLGGEVESLNAAVAAGIALFELRRRRLLEKNG